MQPRAVSKTCAPVGALRRRSWLPCEEANGEVPGQSKLSREPYDARTRTPAFVLDGAEAVNDGVHPCVHTVGTEAFEILLCRPVVLIGELTDPQVFGGYAYILFDEDVDDVLSFVGPRPKDRPVPAVRPFARQPLT